MTDLLKHEDLRAIRFCNKGSRDFFDRHGLDWAEFMKNGLPIELFEAIDDAMCQEVVMQARRRLSGEVS